MDVEQLKEDVREGRVAVDRLVELVVTLQRKLQTAEQRIDELERKLDGSLPKKVDESFSLRAEEERQKRRGKKARRRKPPARRGRITTAEKIKRAKRTEKAFPENVPEIDCKLSHTRVVWRLENGQAVLIAYEVYRGPKNQYGRIPGVLGRSEFGLEIVVTTAYLVYIAGLSFDKVCLLLNFFQNLNLKKSQADALLNQLSRHWEGEFDILCALLANSAVVHTDETSWSIHSVWAFLSEKVRVLLFGVHKDAATLKCLLDPSTFKGIVISDDAAVYANFTQSQKCWAHLLRKAIKLTLLESTNEEYRLFADRLLEIYHEACRVQRDKRLSDAGRSRKVAVLEDEIVDLCGPTWFAELPPQKGSADDYRRLNNELMRLMLAEQLFTFVTAEPFEQPHGELTLVSGTNNESERTLRSSATARDTGRTSKTLRGARRQTILVSVLESLRQQQATFTLRSVIQEIHRWAEVGRSCFADLLEKLNLPPPISILDKVIPLPSKQQEVC